jgi:type VI secretion system secreted protein VgrG
MPDNPTFQLKTALGATALQLHSMQGREEISRLFGYRIVATADPAAKVKLEDLLARPAEVIVTPQEGDKRIFHGLVSEAGFDGFIGRRPSYTLQVVPWPWLATRSRNSRIFQNKSVPDILKAVFDAYGATPKLELTATYRPRAYCVQYRESDFDFASRLMEEEGIFYFFKHEPGKHTLVLGDAPAVFQPLFGLRKLPYRDAWDESANVAAVTSWRWRQAVQTGKITLWDHTYLAPGNHFEGKKEGQAKHPHNKVEAYDYPAGLASVQSDGEPGRWGAESTARAGVRLEEQQARYARAEGRTRSIHLAAGARFELSEHGQADQNGDKVVFATDVVLRAPDAEAAARGAAGAASYEARFEAFDAKVPFRPERRTPKPTIAGAQTATVVGPAGEVVHTDKHARVKVQFHWDREGRSDETSSCFVRVAQGAAGKGFGMLALPRIGHEVVVDFLEGDPDRPLIVGSVYNADNPPPYPLPDNKTISTFKTRSFNGGAADYNELRFDDQQGSEHLALHAQRDRDDSVEHDYAVWIGHDEVRVVDHNRSEHVKANADLTVDKNLAQTVAEDMQLDVGKNLAVAIGESTHLAVGQEFSIDVSAATSLNTGSNLDLKAGANAALEGGANVHVKAGVNLVLEAGVQLTLKAGPASVVLGPDGVSITGPIVKINSGGAAGSGSGAKPKKPTKAKKATKPAKPKDKMDGKHR